MATKTLMDKVQDRATETLEGAQDRFVELNETIAGFVVDRIPSDLTERMPLVDQLPTPKSMFERYWSLQAKALEWQGEMVERNKELTERLLAAWEPKGAAPAKSAPKRAAAKADA